MRQSRYPKIEITTTQPISQGGIGLDSIAGFNITNPVAGQVIVFDGTNWINAGFDLDDLGDINISSLSNGDILQYNGTDWINIPLPPSSVSVNAPITGDGTSGNPLSLNVDIANGVAGLDNNVRHNINDFNSSVDIYGGLAPSDFWQSKHDGTGALSFIYNNGVGGPKAIISNTGRLALDSNVSTGGGEDIVQGIFKASAGQTANMLEVRDSSNVIMAGFLSKGALNVRPQTVNIVSDAIDVTGYGSLVVDTEGAIALDRISSIVGGVAGQYLTIRPVSSSREIVLVHNATSLSLSGGCNYLMHNARCFITLYCVSTGNWYEVSRSKSQTEYKVASIAGGVADITDLYTQDFKTSFVNIDTEALAATDDLDSILGGVEGAEVTIASASTTRTVVVRSGVGNIRLNGGVDRTLDTTRDRLVLHYIANTVNAWVEKSFSDNPL